MPLTFSCSTSFVITQNTCIKIYFNTMYKVFVAKYVVSNLKFTPHSDDTFRHLDGTSKEIDKPSPPHCRSPADKATFR